MVDFDPTTTSTEAFLAEHRIVNGEEDIVCTCGLVPSDSEQLSAHLFVAARSIMYREAAAVLNAMRAEADDDQSMGLSLGFQEMLARAEAAELSGPTSETSASV